MWVRLPKWTASFHIRADVLRGPYFLAWSSRFLSLRLVPWHFLHLTALIGFLAPHSLQIWKCSLLFCASCFVTGSVIGDVAHPSNRAARETDLSFRSWPAIMPRPSGASVPGIADMRDGDDWGRAHSTAMGHQRSARWEQRLKIAAGCEWGTWARSFGDRRLPYVNSAGGNEDADPL